MKITIVTGNKLKIKMYKDALKNIDTQFIDIDLTEIQAIRPKDISLHKVREAYKITKSPVVVDDVGFYIMKYPSYPGIYMKHTFQGLGIENFLQLFNENDEAEVVCSLAYKNETNEMIFIGKIAGKLTKKVKNIDPKNPISSIFIPNGYTKTLENLTSLDNHRTIAINKLKEYLTNETD